MAQFTRYSTAPKTKIDKAKVILKHAEQYCRFGLETDNTTTEPDQAHADAAEIISVLLAGGHSYIQNVSAPLIRKNNIAFEEMLEHQIRRTRTLRKYRPAAQTLVTKAK
jgi:hypothetical protein